MFASLLLAVTIVAHDPGYYTSLATHLKRWLGTENVAARVVTPAEMSAALAQEKIAFLVGFANPSETEMKTLRAYRRRGGKMVVFHSGSAALADLMGVKILGYRAAPYGGAWSRMDFAATVPQGLPKNVTQTSSVLIRAAPIAGRGRVLATWSDRRGRPTGEVAWIATTAGYWMTHVLLADGDENAKAQLLGAIVGSAVPGTWSASASQARRAARVASLTAYAREQKPRAGEIHAVWDHTGCGLYPGDWPRTMRILRDANVSDLFLNIGGAGFAHYASAVLPRSKIYEQEGDQLAACLKAAVGTGIRVHAWLLCFSATRATPDRLEAFRKMGWRLQKTGGSLTEYLDPANAAVREYLLSAVSELAAKPGLAGVHLDFVRWGEGTKRPANAADCVSRFVLAARRRVKAPKWLTAAVYGKYPACVATVGQDWPSWLDTRIVDYAVPMDYTESTAKLAEWLAMQALPRARARRTIVGVGVTANESRLDARQVIDQINLMRRFGFAGSALFDLDTTLERNVLPYLKLGLWSRQ